MLWSLAACLYIPLDVHEGRLGGATADTDADVDTDADTDADADGDTDPDDADGDGWGVAEDCDDDDAGVNPGVQEACDDGVDQDCDGAAWPCAYAEGAASAGTVWTSITGGAAGSAVATGDVDGDGFDEVLVGAPDALTGLGAAWLVPGTPGDGGDLSGGATAEVYGRASCALGSAVALADVDGDGAADAIAGSPGDPTGGAQAGSVSVYLSPGSARTMSADAELAGTAGERFGTAFAVGDLTAAHGAEIVVGAPGSNGGDGRLYVSSAVEGGSPFELAGVTGSGLGAAVLVADLDGDGLLDVAGGAPGTDYTGADDAGGVFLWQGPVVPALYDTLLYATTPGGSAGAALAAADVDRDGVPDLLVGAPGTRAGAVYALRDPFAPRAIERAEVAITLDATASGLGAAIAVVDLDADLEEDVLLGASGADGVGATDGGAVWALAGALSGGIDLLDVHTVARGAEGALAGAAIAAGNFDGDRFGDAVVGAPGDATMGADGGAAYLLFGTTGL